jgi:hypothetical protein
MDFADGCRAIDEVVLGTGVKIALAATHFYGFGVARQWSWDTWLNRGKKKGRGPDVGPRLFRLPTLQGCLRPLLSRKATGGEVPPEVPGCLIAATQLVARQVFHAVGASGYLDCVLRIGSQIGRRVKRNRLVRVVLVYPHAGAYRRRRPVLNKLKGCRSTYVRVRRVFRGSDHGLRVYRLREVRQDAGVARVSSRAAGGHQTAVDDRGSGLVSQKDVL